MILSDKDLMKFINSKKLIFRPSISNSQIRSNHIDLHLSSKILKYKTKLIDLHHSKLSKVKEIVINKDI